MMESKDSLDALRATMTRNDAVPAAGRVWAADGEGTDRCLRFPDTSGNDIKGKAWRTSTEPGVRVRHPAAANDPIDVTRVYGVSSQASAHVPDVIEQEPRGVLAGLLREHGEKAYLSKAREPLGKARIHSGELPARVTGDYTFGAKSTESESAKELLYPAESKDGSGSAAPSTSARYRGISGPGEQRTRGYDWGATTITDPVAHRFGQVNKGALRDGEGAAIALNPSKDPTVPRASAVVPKRVADYRNVRVDHLGHVKPLGRGDAGLAEGEAFGANTVAPDEWGAGDCIRGDYALEDQLPDADLGKSVSKGYRNFTTDPHRVFGVPTIRDDIPAKTSNSVADHQNYGNDATAASLLHPSRFAPIGVDHSDFVESKSAEDIRALFAKIGYTLDDEEFEKIWRRAATAHDLSGDGEVSVEEFRLALNEYDDAREEFGRYPDWW